VLESGGVILDHAYADVDQSRNPFPGLRPFNTDESLLFFGRDGLNDTLLEKLQATRFVAVVGTSGSGKSSLVRAGLLPALRGGFLTDAGSSWRVALFRPINNPIHNLSKSLLECNMFPAHGPSEPSERQRLIEKSLRRSSLGLIEAVRVAQMSPSENLLIVADQFEELYRFEPGSEVERPEEEASAFVKLLLEATRQTEIPIYVILTMRSDYLGESARFWGLPEAINAGQFLIPRMDDDERREAIEGPVKVQGGKIAWSLVNRLLNDVGDDPRQLPILQHTLMRTWEYWSSHKTDSESLSLQHYDNKEVGGMKDSLSINADAAYQELTGEQKVVAEKLFKRLTEKGAGRREGRLPATIDEIAKIAGVKVEMVLPVIEVFRREGRSFLMPAPPVPLTPSTLVDISHESLINGWKRLSGWVDEEAYSAKTYRRLVDDALLYPHGKGPLTNPELSFTAKWKSDHKPNEMWARRYRSEFGKALEGDNPPARPDWAKPDDSEYGIAMEYLRISAREHKQSERERHRRKYFPYALGAVVFLLFICVMLLLFATRAQRAAAEALAARRATEIQAERGNLLEQAIYLDLNRNTPEAIARYKDLKAIYERIGEPSKSALTDILIGNTILFRAPNYKDPALPYFDNALKTARSQNVKFKPSIFVDIGDRLTESLPPDQAIAAVRFYDYASEVIPNENPEVKAGVLIKAADLLARSNKTDDLNNAVARYSEALKLLSSTDPQQITINLRIGDAQYASHRIQEAREAYQKAAELARAAKNSADFGEALRRIGDTYVSPEKDNAKALEAYNRALAAYAVQDPTSSGVNLVFGDARVREAIALVNEQSGNKTQADSFYRQAKKLYSELLKRSTRDFDGFPSMRVEISSRLDGVTNSINRLQVSPR